MVKMAAKYTAVLPHRKNWFTAVQYMISIAIYGGNTPLT